VKGTAGEEEGLGKRPKGNRCVCQKSCRAAVGGGKEDWHMCPGATRRVRAKKEGQPGGLRKAGGEGGGVDG